MRPIQKAARLSLREWMAVARGQLALIRAQFAVWLRPKGQMVRIEAADPTRAPSGIVDDEDVDRVALAVERAAEYGIFRPKCLVKAVALQNLLKAKGVTDSVVRVGVAKVEGGLMAHAWVERSGKVIGDRRWHVDKFDPLGGIGVS